MIRLFLRIHLPAWKKSPLDFFLPALGIAVGVAAIVAIDLGSGSTVASFEKTVRSIEGRTTHQVVGLSTPLDPVLAYSLARIDGVRAAAPILESYALLSDQRDRVLAAERALGGEPLQLIGLDAFAENGIRDLGLDEAESIPGQEEFFFPFIAQSGALLVSRPFLARHGLAPGDSLTVIVGALSSRAHVLGELPERVGEFSVPDNIALCDLATAQELTGRSDASRIDLVLDDAQALARVREVLPEGVGVQAPGGRAARLNEMVRALSVNLRALSYLALFVSLFLIYNAMLLGVLRRRSAIGLSRCLGATRREVLGAWLLEGLCLGIVGTALGIALGTLGGAASLEAVTATASGLYGHVPAGAVELPFSTFVKSILVGLLAALAATAWPAIEAAGTAPAQTASRGTVERKAGRVRWSAPLLALPLLVGAVSLLRWPSESAIPGYLAAASLALAASVLAPAIADAMLRALLPLLRRIGPLPALAARNIRASMSRTGVALAALGVALSMSIAMGTMVGAFRAEMVDWIEETVAADIYISPATSRVSRTEALLDETLIARLAATDGVEAVDTIRGVDVRAHEVDTFAAGIETTIFARRTRPRILQSPSAEEFLARIRDGQAGITESLHRKTGLGTHDTLRVSLGELEVSFVIAGVYKDYSSDRGVVLLEREVFERTFGPRNPMGAALYLEPSQDVDAFVERLQRELASEWSLLVRSHRSLRQEALVVFDRTFAISRVLEIVGIGVAAIGILGALLAMLLERRKEMATLRALALTRRQLGLLMLLESALLSVLAWVLALGLGSSLAWILLRVINVRSFGWSLPWSLPLEAWLANLTFALLAAGLATLWPIVRSRRLSIAAGLREE